MARPIGDTELAVADLVHLRGHAFFECGVHVSTATDIWLPYDLRAQEQWDVYEANAPLASKMRSSSSPPCRVCR